jgi:hypothetical protein
MFSLLLALVGSIPIFYILVGSAIVLFVALEILSDDVKKIQLFIKVRYKLADFVYRLLFELYYPIFFLAILCIALNNLEPFNSVAAIMLVLYAVIRLVSQTYASKTITAVIEGFENNSRIDEMQISHKLRQMFLMLTRIEDANYFYRKEHKHTLSFGSAWQKGQGVLRQSISINPLRTVMNLVRLFRGLFNRGYGTIEMQLIRTAGIEFGYDTHKYRRKAFEFLYANMVVNSYRDYLERSGIDAEEYRNYIIWLYINYARVKVNGKVYISGKTSSLLKLFKKKSISQITEEEFFIWCLGLPMYDHIGPILVSRYSYIVHEFDLNEGTIYKLLGHLEE